MTEESEPPLDKCGEKEDLAELDDLIGDFE